MIIVVNNGQVKTYANATQLTGEKIPGDLNSWVYLGTDPNELLAYSYDVLSQRSSTLYHSHGPVAAAINKQTAYAIGPGLVFRAQPDWEILGMTKAAAKNWGQRFQKLVHYVFQILNYYEKQRTLFRTALIQGDSLLMFDRAVDNLPFDLIETGGDQINFQATGGSDELVTLGIVHDSYLRRRGIYLNDEQSAAPYVDENGDQNIIQFYEKMIARQLRGYPLAYRIIAAAKNNDRFWDATLQRVVMETIMLGYTESEKDDPYRQMTSLADSMKNELGTSDASVTSEVAAKDLAPGNILSFNKGGLKFTDLKAPSNNFDKMQTAYIDLIGMATDTPPEVVLSKYSTSYTAHKGALNDFIKAYTLKRQVFANSVNTVVVREVAKWLFMEGLIEMPHPDFFRSPIIQAATIAGKWLGPVPGHINPAQEVTAISDAVTNGFMLRSDGAAYYGNEWDNMIEEWNQEEEQWGGKSKNEQAAAMAESLDENQDQDQNLDKEVPE